MLLDKEIYFCLVWEKNRNQLVLPRVALRCNWSTEISAIVYSRLEKTFLDKCKICTLSEGIMGGKID